MQRRVDAMLPREFSERHGGDPFRRDTFDAVLLGRHLNFLSLHLGPTTARPILSTRMMRP